MRRSMFVLCGMAALATLGGANYGLAEDLVLRYREPAAKWIEALPIGNGRLGAMVHGGVDVEKLQLNEITIWSGGKDAPWRQDAWKHLEEIRSAVWKEEWKKAEDLTNLWQSETTGYFPGYQTLGDLELNFRFPGRSGETKNYERKLDLKNATVRSAFQRGGVRWTREFIASHPAKLVVGRLTASKPGALSFRATLKRPQSAKTAAKGRDSLVMTGNTDYKGRKGNCDYVAMLKIVPDGGTIRTQDGAIEVENANGATLYLACHTSYKLDWEGNYRNDDDLNAVVEKRIRDGVKKGWDVLRKEHVADYRALFDRFRLQLGPEQEGASKRTTTERIKRFHDDPSDLGFVTLFCQFARYMAISCSRADNPLPANLQGMWGDGLDMPWNCDYHTNINFQMNYWPIDPTGLSELHEPATNLILGLMPSGAITAKAYYNAPGWTCCYTTNAWGWTAPGRRTPWGQFFCGGGWLCQMLFDHYAYTGDKAYLKRVWPALKENARFLQAALVEGPDGRLSMCPSLSPENEFKTSNGKGTVAWGVEMDSAIVREAFRNALFAGRVLNDPDKEFLRSVAASLEKMRPMTIGRYGQIQEWGPDFDDPKDEHRHVSQLYGLHPGTQIDPKRNPELAKAAKIVLDCRGDAGTGWSKAWKISFHARLLDGDRAYKLLREQLVFTDVDRIVMHSGGIHANLFDAHPPFQIDGNFGALAGVTEMLLQSHLYEEKEKERIYVLHLLPALPKALRDGKVSGLRARGGFEVSMEWKDGALVSAKIKSVGGRKFILRHGDAEREFDVKPGGVVRYDGK